MVWAADVDAVPQGVMQIISQLEKVLSESHINSSECLQKAVCSYIQSSKVKNEQSRFVEDEPDVGGNSIRFVVLILRCGVTLILKSYSKGLILTQSVKSFDFQSANFDPIGQIPLQRRGHRRTYWTFWVCNTCLKYSRKSYLIFVISKLWVNPVPCSDVKQIFASGFYLDLLGRNRAPDL